MLILTRKLGQWLYLGDNIRILITGANGAVKLAIDSPKEVKVMRGEIIEREKKEPQAMRLPGFEKIIPPKPTIRDEAVARTIAERIVEIVNLDDFYWTESQCEEHIFEAQQKIMLGCAPAKVFADQAQWQGDDMEAIDDHCRAIADGIASEALQEAIARWRERYEVEQPKPGTRHLRR